MEHRNRPEKQFENGFLSVSATYGYYSKVMVSSFERRKCSNVAR